MHSRSSQIEQQTFLRCRKREIEKEKDGLAERVQVRFKWVPHLKMLGNTSAPWSTASSVIFKSRSTSRENVLHLVSHEKFHFSRETRTRRDLAHGYFILRLYTKTFY